MLTFGGIGKQTSPGPRTAFLSKHPRKSILGESFGETDFPELHTSNTPSKY